MKIQKVMFALCFVLFAMTSCQKEELSGFDANGKQLPTMLAPNPESPTEFTDGLNCTIDERTPFVLRVDQTGSTVTLTVEENDGYEGQNRYRGNQTDWTVITENGTQIESNQATITVEASNLDAVTMRVPFGPKAQKGTIDQVEITLCEAFGQVSICEDENDEVMECEGDSPTSKYMICKEN